MQRRSWTSNVCVFLTAVAVLAACKERDAAVATQADLAELDRGVGLMGKFEFDAAQQLFARLAHRYPRWFEARFDAAVARLNRQGEGDERAAGDALRSLRSERPEDLNVGYTLGLIALRGEPPKTAEALLRKVVEQDARDPYAVYFLAQAVLAQGRAEEALRLFERAAELDPGLRSAQYGAAQALGRLGRERDAQARMEEFERQGRNPLSRLAEFKYTRMGPKSEALPASRKPAAIRVPSGPLFAAAVPLLAPGQRRPGMPSAADIDGDGSIDLFIPGGRGAPGTVLLNSGAGLRAQQNHALAKLTGVDFAAWGDIDNDGLTDVLLCRAEGPPLLVRNGGAGKWTPLSVPALSAVRGARDCMLLDADHDGDLDILLVTTSGERVLISNNGDGTFRSLTQRLPKPSAGRALQLVAADFNNDRTVDLVVLHEGGPHEALDNALMWSWRPAKGFDTVARLPAVAAAAADIRASGEVGMLILTPRLGVQRWQRARDGRWVSEPLIAEGGEPRPGARAQIAIADVDGDGNPEIVTTSARGIAVSRSSGERLWELEDASVVSWLLANLDERGPSLVTVHADGSVALHAPGAGRGPFLNLALSGRLDPANSIRSNASGAGARVAARISGRWVVDQALRNGSGPGQSLAPLALGTGGAAVDYVRIDWSDGVFQTETGVVAPKLQRIAETQRQLSSCPLIFAWDGRRYAFVSDFLGVGGLGYLVAPGEYAHPRPWENFLLPEGLLQPKEGRYALKVAEPMEEAAYIDALRLAVYDLPPGWRMALDERMQIGEPKVTGAPLYYRHFALPDRARNERGEDVTDALRSVDRKAAEPGKLDARFIGRLAGEHVLTLEFSAPLDAAERGKPVLIADGWIEYPYSQTMFAAWQARAAYHAPTLEAQGADGRWRVLLPEFGYPAGMPRTIAVPLPRLPKGTRTLRLRTNQQIYWDRIAVGWAEDAPAVKRILPLARALVQQSGFPRRSTGPQQQPDYDYEHRQPLWDTRVQAGRYTDFGPAEALIAEPDDALAIIGAGEEIHVEFAAELSPPRQGWTRRFVLETHGWAKDMDLYTRDRDTLAPLPAADAARAGREELSRRFNRRAGS